MNYICGCYFHVASTEYHIRIQKHYLPLVDSTVHSTILSTTSRTVLKQKFTNPSSTEAIKECIYTFPLYDGVSVVSFTCRIGKKVLRGLVKEKVKAKQIFDDAVAKGETAGLLEQAPEASDVFSTKLGNIPAGQSVIVEITYIGELKHHETDGIRFTIPTKIAPRYGSGPALGSMSQAQDGGGIKITVDVNMPEGSFIKAVQSPSHPISVSMGTVSTATAADPLMSKASATLSLGSSALEKDFVLIVQSKDIGIPKAILETHPTIRNHRALMATLVPKFSLPPSRPEIVFVADRSGSMQYNMDMLISAMKVFLKSMPVGVKFNICSFGSSHTFLWPKSQSYSQETLQQATDHLLHFRADMGGTETFRAIKATIERRFTDIPLEIMLLTDGDIWRQEDLFKYVNEQVEQTNGNIRIFPLGIGNGVSHALIEGLARAGNGFAQAVQNGERLDNCVVRMLRGALSPHITDYTLEIKYEKENDDFELIDKVTEGLKILLSDEDQTVKEAAEANKPTISLFDTTANPEKEDLKGLKDSQFWLPKVPFPKLHQAPHKIPTLFAFSRTSVYLLMSPETIQRNPTAVVLRATSTHGPLALEIPIESLSTPAETIHQLAAKKAVQDLEEGRGWIYDAKDQNGTLVKDRYPSCFDDLVEREAVRLGEKFQIAGKWCSFVAVAANDKEIADKESENIEQKALVIDDDGDIYGDTDMGYPETHPERESDDEEYEMIGGSAPPAPPYQPVTRSVPSLMNRARGRGAPRLLRTQMEINDRSHSANITYGSVSAHQSRSPQMPQQLFGAAAPSGYSFFASTCTPNNGNANVHRSSALFGQAAQTPQTNSLFAAPLSPGGGAVNQSNAFSFGNPFSSNSSSEKVLLPKPFGASEGTAFGSQNPTPFGGRSVGQSLFGAQSASPAPPSSNLFGRVSAPSGPDNGPVAPVVSRNRKAVSSPFGSMFRRSKKADAKESSPTSPGFSPTGLSDADDSFNIYPKPSSEPAIFAAAAPSQQLSQGQQFLTRPAPIPLPVHSQAALAAPQASTPQPPRAPAPALFPSTDTSGGLAATLRHHDSDWDDSEDQSFEPRQHRREQPSPRRRTSTGFKKPCSPVPLDRERDRERRSVRTPGESLIDIDTSDALNFEYHAPAADWSSKSIAERVLALIALQTFEGSWPGDSDEVLRIMGMDGSVGGKGVDRRVWFTLLAVKWFEIFAGDEEGTWGLVVEKARGWLEGQMEVEGWEAEAGKVVEGLRKE